MQDLILTISIAKIAGYYIRMLYAFLKLDNDWTEVVDALRRFHSRTVDDKKGITIQL